MSMISIDNHSLDCSKLIDYKQDIDSINFTYSCSNETNSLLITIYTLRFE
jgi:hypothetical protein